MTVTINVKSSLTNRDETYISTSTPGLRTIKDIIKNGLRLLGCRDEFDIDDNIKQIKYIQEGTDNVFTITVS